MVATRVRGATRPLNGPQVPPTDNAVAPLLEARMIIVMGQMDDPRRKVPKPTSLISDIGLGLLAGGIAVFVFVVIGLIILAFTLGPALADS